MQALPLKALTKMPRTADDQCPAVKHRGARLERYRVVFRLSNRTKSYQKDEVEKYRRALYRFSHIRPARISKPRFTFSTSGECYVSFFIAKTNAGAMAGKTFFFEAGGRGSAEVQPEDLASFGMDKIRASYAPRQVMAPDNVRLRRKLGLRSA